MSWRRNLRKFLLDNWHVKALSLTIAVILVYFNNVANLEVRTIEIPLEARLPLKHLPASEIPDSISVILRGESDGIINVLGEDIRAFIDLTPYQEAGLYTVTVQIERKGAAFNIEPLTITSNPPQFSIRLEDQITRELAVAVDIQGALAAGYQLTKTSIIPQTVEITGPRNVLGRMVDISTQPVNISNQAASSAARAQLIVPGPYVEFLNRDSVNVVFEVGEVPIIRNVENIKVEIVNLRRRFVASYVLGNSFVIARALPSQLNQLTSENVRFVIDAEGISAVGQHTLSLTPQLPPRLQTVIEVIDYQPKTLFLTMETQ